MFDIGTEVTLSVAVALNLGQGRQAYMPGDIYGTVIDRCLDKDTVTVAWYQSHSATRLPSDCVKKT